MQVVALAAIFACPALLCLSVRSVADPDIWWHLRTAEWILQHHGAPRVDLYSSSNAGQPWAAYSWLFEVLTFKLFQFFGLRGVLGYTVAMVLAIVAALRHLIARLQPDFSLVILLTLASFFAMGHVYTPRPWLFTFLFFILEVDILMQVRRTGRVRELVWLPLIFALWANIHIQFIDGLLVLGLAVAEALLARRKPGDGTALTIPAAFAVLGGSVLATLFNPYGWHIYRVAYDLASQPGVMDKIQELQAIPFRGFLDYLVLFFALAATASLAYTRRFPVFETGLLMFGAFVSFRSQRDVFVIATASAVILASTLPGRHSPVRLSRFAATYAAVAAALIALAGFRLLGVTNDGLEKRVAASLPVDAVNAIRARGYAGPVFNDFTWGGYLIWSLRMPVSLDGRTTVYGDKAIDRSIVTWNAQPDWNTDPLLTSAGIIIGPRKAALFQLLRTDRHYKLVYEDKLAAVFIPQNK